MSNAESSGLLQRYRRVWRQSWRQRREMDAPKRLAHEVQFLPAALELQDKPSHPAPRILCGRSWRSRHWRCCGPVWARFM